MTRQENESFLKYLEQYKKQVTQNKKVTKKFLKELDDLTENGKLPRGNKILCTQSDRG